MIDPTAKIDPTARIDDTIHVGPRTVIWSAKVIRGTKLGADCIVVDGAVLDGPTFGDRCIISHNVAMGPGFEFGNDVFIGPNVTICNDRWPMANKDGFRPDLLRRGFVAVRVKDGASIGANAVVLPGVTIGKRAMVAAGAVAHCDVPDDYVFWRDGSMCRIKPEWRARRMREAA